MENIQHFIACNNELCITISLLESLATTRKELQNRLLHSYLTLNSEYLQRMLRFILHWLTLIITSCAQLITQSSCSCTRWRPSIETIAPESFSDCLIYYGRMLLPMISRRDIDRNFHLVQTLFTLKFYSDPLTQFGILLLISQDSNKHMRTLEFHTPRIKYDHALECVPWNTSTASCISNSKIDLYHSEQR